MPTPFIPEVVARDESNHVKPPIYRRDNQPVHRVPGRAAPMHTADAAGNIEGALKARWSENAIVTILLKHRLAGFEIFGSGAENVLGVYVLRRQGRWCARKWLGGPGLFTIHIALRHWPLLNRKQRLSRHAIEEEQVPRLRADGHGRPILTGEEQWRRSNVVIPKIVMDSLEGPDPFAGRCFQDNDGVCVLIVARAKAAKVVGAGA